MRYHRSGNVTWELVDERAVILDARGGTLTTLNPVGTLIWRHLDVPRPSEDVHRHLAARFPEVDADALRSDTDAFIARLADEGLVVATADGG